MKTSSPHIDIKKIIDLRQKLHKFPEPSGNEQITQDIIENFFRRYKPKQVIKFNKGGIAFGFGNLESKQKIIFRAELDALPIDESKSQLPYRSVNDGFAHKCGHDGHIAILTGLAEAIVNNIKNISNHVIFLFQPAEETLQGAVEIISDPQFKQIEPTYIIGFHNIPKYEKNTILIKPAEITNYVTGMKIILKGQSQHAAYSQSNLALLVAIEQLIKFLNDFAINPATKGQINITHLNYGKPTFGISPDQITIHLTLRAETNDKLDELIDFTENQIKNIAYKNKLSWKIQYIEDAPAVYNDFELFEIAHKVAQQLNRKTIILDKPFPWGEDFGFYTVKYKGLFIGIGSGVDTPQLHTNDYDFPDEIIYPSVEYLFNLYRQISNL